MNRADKVTLQEFAASHMSCAVCWWPEMDMRRRLEIHHLVQGAGRKHDRRNLLSLCQNCHAVFHSGSKVTGLPDLNKGILLACKRESDPEFFDPQFLAGLRHKQHLGYEPEPLPPAYEEQRQKNTTGWRHRTP